MILVAQTPQPSFDWLEVAKSAIAPLMVAFLLAFLTALASRLSLGFWARWNWLTATQRWRLGTWWRRRRVLLVCIADQVLILEQLRERIVKRCNDLPNSTIYIHVWTQQSLSDWPVAVDEKTPMRTPLEDYAYNFSKFLRQASLNGLAVHISRVIIIPSYKSTRGRGILKQLTKDVNNSEYYDRYIALLHNSPCDDQETEDDGKPVEHTQGAFFYTYDRPWPAWLSDVVCYGIRTEDRPVKWLWAVSSSFGGQEDLCLLRLHRRLNKRLARTMPFPREFESLKELAENAGNTVLHDMYPLSRLRKNKDARG